MHLVWEWGYKYHIFMEQILYKGVLTASNIGIIKASLSKELVANDKLQNFQGELIGLAKKWEEK